MHSSSILSHDNKLALSDIVLIRYNIYQISMQILSPFAILLMQTMKVLSEAQEAGSSFLEKAKLP